MKLKKQNLKSMEINSANIQKMLDRIRSELSIELLAESVRGILLPRGKQVLSKRYRGSGRPRKTDYDYKKINWKKILKGSDFMVK